MSIIKAFQKSIAKAKGARGDKTSSALRQASEAIDGGTTSNLSAESMTKVDDAISKVDFSAPKTAEKKPTVMEGEVDPDEFNTIAGLKGLPQLDARGKLFAKVIQNDLRKGDLEAAKRNKANMSNYLMDQKRMDSIRQGDFDADELTSISEALKDSKGFIDDAKFDELFGKVKKSTKEPDSTKDIDTFLDEMFPTKEPEGIFSQGDIDDILADLPATKKKSVKERLEAKMVEKQTKNAASSKGIDQADLDILLGGSDGKKK